MSLKSTGVSIEELKQLVEEAGREPLSEEGQRKLEAMVGILKTMIEQLEAGDLTIEQACALLCDEAAAE